MDTTILLQNFSKKGLEKSFHLNPKNIKHHIHNVEITRLGNQDVGNAPGSIFIFPKLQ